MIFSPVYILMLNSFSFVLLVITFCAVHCSSIFFISTLNITYFIPGLGLYHVFCFYHFSQHLFFYLVDRYRQALIENIFFFYILSMCRCPEVHTHCILVKRSFVETKLMSFISWTFPHTYFYSLNCIFLQYMHMYLSNRMRSNNINQCYCIVKIVTYVGVDGRIYCFHRGRILTSHYCHVFVIDVHAMDSNVPAVSLLVVCFPFKKYIRRGRRKG